MVEQLPGWIEAIANFQPDLLPMALLKCAHNNPLTTMGLWWLAAKTPWKWDDEIFSWIRSRGGVK